MCLVQNALLYQNNAIVAINGNSPLSSSASS